MITALTLTIVAGAPPVKVYTATGPTTIAIGTNGGGLYVGGTNTVSPTTGFLLSNTVITFPLKNGDALWTMATSKTILSILATS